MATLRALVVGGGEEEVVVIGENETTIISSVRMMRQAGRGVSRRRCN